MRWDPAAALADPHNPIHLLGSCPGLAMEIPPGQSRTLRLALGCHLPGNVTTRLPATYLYTRYYQNLPDVLNAALDRFASLKQQSQALDQKLLASPLNPDQQFLLAHATRSYHGNTQLLETQSPPTNPAAPPSPFWIVNEGEYAMMNTLDLSLDHLFWEVHHNPWVLKNLLDHFSQNYSYRDQLGLSFTHDMGVRNQFSPAGHSSYELAHLTGCFSYMTAEQLCNWTLIAASYLAKTNDLPWARQNLPRFDDCLQSLINRGPATGLIEFDSSRCGPPNTAGSGAEITTYDSLDHSLAQTRNNLYIAIKTWAAYQGLQLIYALLGKTEPAARAADMQSRIIARLAQAQNSDGSLPAVLEPGNPGFHSRILPAIEGLAYPLLWNQPHTIPQPLLTLLHNHSVALLADPQHRNHFPDGGIKLSSTSNNSWPSKIAIFQHVARQLLRLTETGAPRTDPTPASGWERSDAAHTRWQTEGESAYWACSDQIISGVAKGSKYYPRAVTALLFLAECSAHKL